MRTISAFSAAVCLLAACGRAGATSISLCDSAPHNLVANCGFETGDFTSWTLSGNDVPDEAGSLYGVEGVDPDTTAPHSGNYQAYFADLDSNATTLAQTLPTEAGDSYTVSFYLAQDTMGSFQYSNELMVSLGGQTLANLAQIPANGYTQYSYMATDVAAMSVLSITLGNDLGEFLLDDVSVVDTTPEPATGWLLLGSGVVVAAGRLLGSRYWLRA